MGDRLLWFASKHARVPGDSGCAEGTRVEAPPEGSTASEAISVENYDGIVLASNTIGEDSDTFLAALASRETPLPTFVLASEGTSALRNKLEQMGVEYHPIASVSLEALDRALTDFRSSHSQSGFELQPAWARMLVGESDSVRRVREMIRLIADRSCTVLITGETGTGKEVVARSLHQASRRSGREMVAVNCAALPSELLESELFGHTKGAFTGADSNRIGRFEQANGGTILLDEIGEMPVELQPKVLRALQEREVLKIGGSSPIKIDARIIAATNCDLRDQIEQRRFRQDLYYRLNVVQIHLDPLRERPEDIGLLVDHFVEKICRREDLPPKRLACGVIQHLQAQIWPGNIRELEHAVERAIALSGSRSTLDLYDFAPYTDVAPLRGCDSASLCANGNASLNFEAIVGRLERALIGSALKRADGNKAKAAELLGLKRSTLISKAKALAVCA